MKDVHVRLEDEFRKLQDDDGHQQLQRILESTDKTVAKFWAEVEEDGNATDSDSDFEELGFEG